MRRIIFMLAIVAVFVLSGCTDNGGGSGTATVYYGGSQGIVATFEKMGMENNGVEEVWEGMDFPVEVTVRNKGEEDVSPGDVTIKIQGIDTALYQMSSSSESNKDMLEKVSETNSLGGEETISFGNARLDDIKGMYVDAHFFASVEYKYKTHVAVPEVCFKEDFQDDSLCELSGAKSVSSSGAPIRVTKVTQEPSGARRISLTFDIENVGGGRVTTPTEDFHTHYDKLSFELTEGASSDITFECASSGSRDTARFDDSKMARVVCKSSELPEGTLFKKQLTLDLSYKYKSIVEKDVRVRNEP